LLGLTAVLAVALLLVVGLVYAARDTLTTEGSSTPPPGPARSSSSTTGSVPVDRDQIAATPMLTVTADDAQPTTPATVPGPVIDVPPATRTGPAGVATGFPRTAEGAIGQLAAVEVAVLQAMSIRYTHTVYDGWAMPGGIGADGWAMTANVQAFLTAAKMTDQLDMTATVVATPAAGQVKGVDGLDWVVACVLVEVRATITVEARMGYGHCERMQWNRGRWMIAPGPAPARAPSTWPGSERSVQAGWRTWSTTDRRGRG
jgi:hypothetical protein